MQRILQVILAAWAGSLWTICALVAPSLFALIPERHIAGQVAGHFFQVAAWLGLTLGAGAFVLFVRRAVGWITRLDYGLLVVAVLAPLASELVVRQLLNSARVTGDMSWFGLLHALSAVLYGAACVITLLLVWRLSAPPRQRL